MRNLGYWLVRMARPPLFGIRIRAGVTEVSKGPLPAGLLPDLADVVREFGIVEGYVDAVAQAGRVVVRFSRGVPAASHQRFRNVVGARRIRA